VTKARAWKGVGQECNSGVTFTFLGVRESVREWAQTLPNGLPLWELESWWTFEPSENNSKGQNSLDWKIPHTIGKLLRYVCLKCGHIIYLSTHNTSYVRKKGRESKCQFDSQPLKVRNHLELCVCKWRVTYFWKVFDKNYNFSLELVSIRGLHKKLWAFKVVKVPILGISKLPTWESWEKWHLGQPLWPIIENIIRGKMVPFSSLSCGESYEFMHARGLFVHQK
jgi:hypothetical protein